VALNTNKWDVRGVGPRALGFVSPEAVKVENGFLKLGAFKRTTGFCWEQLVPTGAS